MQLNAIPHALLVVLLLTRLNRVVFDSFLHFHSIAAGDGSALEEGKTRKVTVPHTYVLLWNRSKNYLLYKRAL